MEHSEHLDFDKDVQESFHELVQQLCVIHDKLRQAVLPRSSSLSEDGGCHGQRFEEGLGLPVGRPVRSPLRRRGVRALQLQDRSISIVRKRWQAAGEGICG